MTTPDEATKSAADVQPAYLVFDCESIPDGRLLGMVQYPGESLSEEDAISRAQDEARDRSRDGSDFLPVTYQFPVAVCVARVAGDFTLQNVTCLDTPQFRTREIVAGFWRGVSRYKNAQLVTFNGRGFDLPLLEL